ncbi:MAG: hypothetical protein GXC76_16865, partial [Rhodanobacteraceae bacterium]|nr:hypothetical protein [Rhodanobacteraceae bacterium]
SWPALQWSPPSTQDTCLYYWVPPDAAQPDDGAPQVAYTGNLVWQVKSDACPDDSRCGDDAFTRDCLWRLLTDASSAALIDTARRHCHR